MKNTEITLRETIEKISTFCPIKIIFNNMVLYNDYDSEVEIENGAYGEIMPSLAVVPHRISKFDKSVVTSINIEIVDYHHSIVIMQGEYIENV